MMSSLGSPASTRLPSIPLAYKTLQQIESQSSTKSENVLHDFPEAGSAQNSASEIKYWISMTSFERYLLQAISELWNLNVDSFGKNKDDESLLEYLFSQWDWSYETQAFLSEAFWKADGKKETRKETYNNVLHILGRLPFLHLRRQYRVDKLKIDNNDFLANLGDRHFSNVKFEPGINDSYHWKVLVAMYRDCPEEMEFWTNALTRRKTYGTKPSSWKTWVLQYDIWKVVRMFDLHKRRPENAPIIIELFTMSEKASIFQASLRLPISMVEDKPESTQELEKDASGNNDESVDLKIEIASNEQPVAVLDDVENVRLHLPPLGLSYFFVLG